MCKKRSIFINGVIILTSGVLCFLVFPPSVNVQSNLYVKIFLNCIGFFIALTGQFLRISARGYKTQVYGTKAKLINEGPYGIVRNPMYLGSFFIGLGAFMILFPWWVVPIYTVFFLLWYAYQINGEQQHLKQKFGLQYINYCRKVHSFFPKPSSLFRRTIFRAFPFRFGWIKKEWQTIAVWVGLIAIHEGYINIAIYPLIFLIAEIAAFVIILIVSLSLIRMLCEPTCLC
jgi:protein-S-isoprenylcysteine O-methyltransferase Ste14